MRRNRHPNIGFAASIEQFHVSELQIVGELGAIFEDGSNRYQLFKLVDAGATAKDLVYVKSYSAFTCTPTIGNSSRREVAGVVTVTSLVNEYIYVKKGGVTSVKADDPTLARGDAVVADSASNRVTAGSKTLTGALASAADTAGAILALANPWTDDMFIDFFSITRSTKSTGASTADFGVTSTSATTLSDNLIDGVNSGAAEGTENNFLNGGTNGKVRQVWPAGKWITGSTASGAIAGLVGTYIVKVSHITDVPSIGIAQGAVSGGFVDVALDIPYN